MAALFCSIVLLWFSEIIPLAATGLMVPTLAILYGVTHVKLAFAPFGNQILFLFIGSFLLAKSMEKHQWDKRMAYLLLSSKWGAQTPFGLSLQISLICWVLSMWISNTASCAIATPMVLGLVNSLKDEFPKEQDRNNLTIKLLLISAFASSIGGMATPVGSPPNLMAIQFLADKGIEISFFNWMLFGLPVSLTMLVALHLILSKKFPVDANPSFDMKLHFKEKRKLLGPIKKEELQVATLFCLAVFLWVSPGMLKMIFPNSPIISAFKSQLPMGVVALMASLPLFFLENEKGERNINWKDAAQIDWGTILLFGGGLTLGTLLDQSGLATSLGSKIFSLPGENLLILGLIIIIAGILISEFSSNTASTAIIVPLILGALSSLSTGDATLLVVAAAFGASFGFMLPVSTPPNAIVYGTGRIPLKKMIQTGVLFDLSGMVIIFLIIIVLGIKTGLF